MFRTLLVVHCLPHIFREAGCTPFVASIMADIFPAELRGAALGIYNWGIYMGYSMSYAIGNLITKANINGQVSMSLTYMSAGLLKVRGGCLKLRHRLVGC